jgi:hypothetical protein
MEDYLNFLGEAGDESLPIDLVNGGDDDDDDDEVGRNANAGEGIESASAREVTPVPEAKKPPAKHTIKSLLCGKKAEVLTLPERKKFLMDLVDEGHQQIFSSQYIKDHVVEITNLLEAIRFSSQKMEWLSSKVAEQMVELHGHLVADTEKRRRSRASTAFLSFIGEVAKRVNFENTAIENRLNRDQDLSGAVKRTGRKNSRKPGVVEQLSHTWDPKKKDPLPCPGCNHFTVMKVRIEEAPSVPSQCAAHKKAVARWEAAPTDKRSKNAPTISSLKLGKTVERHMCMCCVMSCTKGSNTCPHCKAHPPKFAPTFQVHRLFTRNRPVLQLGEHLEHIGQCFASPRPRSARAENAGRRC